MIINEANTPCNEKILRKKFRIPPSDTSLKYHFNKPSTITVSHCKLEKLVVLLSAISTLLILFCRIYLQWIHGINHNIELPFWKKNRKRTQNAVITDKAIFLSLCATGMMKIFFVINFRTRNSKISLFFLFSLYFRGFFLYEVETSL